MPEPLGSIVPLTHHANLLKSAMDKMHWHKLRRPKFATVLAMLLAGVLILTVLLLQRHKELTALYEETLEDTFLPRMEAIAVQVEEEVFRSLLRYHVNSLVPQDDAIATENLSSALLFIIITDSLNCSNGLETDIEILNSIAGSSNATVQGFHMDERVTEFASMHDIRFPIREKPSWNHLPALAKIGSDTPLVLVYDVGSGLLIGAHHPIPDDALKSRLFYKRWAYRGLYEEVW